MKTASTRRRSLNSSLGVLHVSALLAFAERDHDFATWLFAALHNTDISASGMGTMRAGTRTILIPRTAEAATRRAQWLLGCITEQRIDGHRDAATMLHTWYAARAHDEPRAVVLGLKYGIIDFGVIGHPKRRHEPMDIVMRDDVFTTVSSVKMARIVSTLSHRVVEQGLIAANGHTAKLEPELGDWLFGDKHIAIHRSPTESLATIAADVANINAPHALMHDENGVVALAFTPSIDLTDLAGSDKVRAVR